MGIPYFQKCPRCQGFLVGTHIAGQESEYPFGVYAAWRCVNCGEFVDSQVLTNREAQENTVIQLRLSF